MDPRDGDAVHEGHPDARTPFPEKRPPAASGPRRLALLAGIGAVAVAVFFADTRIPLGYDVSTAYVVVVWLAARLGGERPLWLTTAALTGLTLLGFVLSPEGGEPALGAFNRAVSILVMLIAAYAFSRSMRSAGAAAESETRLREVIDSALDCVITMNDRGVITGWNPQAESVFGWSAQAAIGRRVADLIIPEEMREPHRAGLRRFIDTGHGPVLNRRVELEALRRDGARFPIELAITPLRLAGRFEFSAFVRDISDRKRFEFLQRNLNATLEERVARRTEQLSKTNQALERSNAELRRFAYAASHDLQTPLRSISGFAQLLRQKFEGEIDPQADEWIARTVQGTERMRRLIEDLLAYARVDAGEPPTTDVPMADVYRDVVALLERNIEDAGATLRATDLPVIPASRPQMTQLLLNLVGNALKFRGEAAPVIETSAARDGAGWRFAVRDNGIGIDPRHHADVFELFRRLHGPQAYEGTGIGLAICRKVVEGHGGRLWIESEPGRGTVFHFWLPDLAPVAAGSGRGGGDAGMDQEEVSDDRTR